MKAILRNISVSMVALLCGVFMMSSGVALAAANPSYTACGYTGAAGSPVCSTSSADPLTGKNGIIVKATNIIALVAGVAAVIMIIVSGIKFITSQGDPSSVAEARKTIIYTAVGLVVIVLARTIITYVVSKV